MKKNMRATVGSLYVVATPIGHLADISQRAIETLRQVDFILAEDTRHSLRLLQALGIQKSLSSFHAHNEAEKSQSVIQALLGGQNVALISDAGTPLISDPGFTLVRAAREAGIPVTPIPGSCALIAALSVSGVASDSFTFIGFLPAKNMARCQKLEQCKAYGHTVIAYESTHRIEACTADIMRIYGEDYKWVMAKELTKTFETILSARAIDIHQWLQNTSHTKGEFVLILPAVPSIDNPMQDEQLLVALMKELPLKKAVTIAAEALNKPKNQLYERALQLKKAL